jgi:hypothetical protein
MEGRKSIQDGDRIAETLGPYLLWSGTDKT